MTDDVKPQTREELDAAEEEINELERIESVEDAANRLDAIARRLLISARAGLEDRERLDVAQRRLSALALEGEEGCVVELTYLEEDNDGEELALSLPHPSGEYPDLRTALDDLRAIVTTRSGGHRTQPGGGE